MVPGVILKDFVWETGPWACLPIPSGTSRLHTCSGGLESSETCGLGC